MAHGADGTQPKRPISRWWPIGVAIAAIVFFAIGGGLAGAWSSSLTNSCLDNFNYGYSGYYCNPTGNMGLWEGAIACLVIGALLKLTFWILLILYCVQRRRAREAGYYNNAYNIETGNQAPNYTQNVPMAPANVPPLNDSYPNPQELPTEKGPQKFCGQCGAAGAGGFCTQCGAQI